MLRIITAAIAGSVIIFVICTLLSKKGWPIKIPGMRAGWKTPFVFLWANFLKPKKLIAWIIFGATGYGIYLLACYLWPTPEHLAFRELANNLAEKETKPYADRLKELAVQAKGKGLSVEEKREAEQISKKTENIRKNYSQGNLILPPSKPAFSKPKEEVWIFAWTATDGLMNENHQQKPSSEYAATDVTYSEKELSFVCFKGSKREDKIVLTRDNKEEKYMGYLFNKAKREYTKIWLSPENDYFKGYIFANGGPKILATLKKQNHL